MSLSLLLNVVRAKILIFVISQNSICIKGYARQSCSQTKKPLQYLLIGRFDIIYKVMEALFPIFSL